MDLGQLRGPSWLTGAPQHCPNQKGIVTLGGLGVCDGGHSLVVMKKGSTRYPVPGTLSDHFKSGQPLSLQNRPTEVARNLVGIFNLMATGMAQTMSRSKS